MIAIINVSDKYSKIGEQVYEVKINSLVITTFKHKAEEGLAVCLRKASEAVERERWLSSKEYIEHLTKDIKEGR